ncbi:uncharacterized protein [Littorina saxatilis]|uniref:Glycosyltransferase family 32 protein n=2 Tax=Littorina saxatilis TaxID=31220 RepID=A0AAN9BMJ9_9CAEN
MTFSREACWFPTETMLPPQLRKHRRVLLVLTALLFVLSLLLWFVNIGQQPFTASRSTRDLLWQEPWPERQIHDTDPQSGVTIVHYVWSGRKRKFVFRDCLSLLSVVRVLQPLKIIFHYSTMPQTDSYHSWLLELKSSIPGLEFKQANFGSSDLMDIAFEILPPEGGVVIGNGAVLSRPPPHPAVTPISLFLATFASDPSQGIVFASKSLKELPASDLNKAKSASKKQCVHVDAYDSDLRLVSHAHCVIMASDVLPRDIYAEKTPSAELAQWIFYGRRALQVAKQDFRNPIPRISHYVILDGGKDVSSELRFPHFLNILSALYVGGFERVYLHAETAPRGHWWEELAGENVTVVKADRPRSVYQTEVKVIQHVSDVLRAEILYKYGGAYQDFDVTWTKRVPDWLLAYPTVIDLEVEYNKASSDWPDIFNNGVILSRRHAPWLRHFLESMRDYRDDDWAYNSLRMSYRTFEHYPDTVYIDKYLQVMCGETVCHPSWGVSYDTKVLPLSAPFPLRQEARSFHLGRPRPQASLASLDSVKHTHDAFADIGRMVLEKSGRKNLLG